MADQTSTRIYVGNLLYQVQPEEIMDMLKDNGISITNLDISIDPFSGRNPSYCFIDVATPEDAQVAFERLQGAQIRGRPLKIGYDTGRKPPSTHQRARTQTTAGKWRDFERTPATNSPYVYDTWKRTDAREHWTKPVDEGRRLYVGGLSDISSQKFVNDEMRQLFADFEIEAVSKRILPEHRNLAIPATGQCYCFVDFPSAEEARRAIAEVDGTPTPHGGRYRVNTANVQGDRKVCREQAGILGSHGVAAERKRDLGGDWRARA